MITLSGISGNVKAIDYPVGALRKILNVNVVGTFLVAREAGRLFRRQRNPGSIVIVASMSGTNVNQFCDKFGVLWEPTLTQHRVSTLAPTMHPKPLYCNWHEISRPSGAAVMMRIRLSGPILSVWATL